MRDPEVEALRRRLYAPGASREDVAAYTGAANPEPEEARTTPPEYRSIRPLLIAGIAALVSVGVLVAVLLPRTPVRPGPRLPSPAAVVLASPERVAMLRNLARGDDAGIAAYLISRESSSQLPGPVPLSIVEEHGRGPGLLRLGDDPLAGGPGRVTVLVMLPSAGTQTWSADRLIIDRHHAVRPSPLTRQGGAQEAGELTAATFAYRGGQRPVRVRIDVPPGTAWDAAVAIGP